MRREAGWIFMLCICLEIPFTVKGEEKTWYEARKHCQRMGGRLSDASQENSYWTSSYKRVSLWIKMIGCYRRNEIYRSDEIKMRAHSVGFCQELCSEKSVSTFAVMNSKCICIQNENKSALNKLPASQCNYNCSRYSDKLTYFECGGSSAYNIYATVNTPDINNQSKEAKCMALKCGKDPEYLQTCKRKHQGVCQSYELAPGNATSWREAMDSCKSSNPSSYLLGKVNLLDANLSCQLLNNTEPGPKWIGVAKQIYTSFDRGQNIKEMDIVQCQMCKKGGGCQYVNCSNKAEFKCGGVKETTRKSVKNTINPKDNSEQGIILSTYSVATHIPISTKGTSVIKPTISNPSTRSHINMESESMGKSQSTQGTFQWSQGYTNATSIFISTKRTSVIIPTISRNRTLSKVNMKTKSVGYLDTEKDSQFNIFIPLSIIIPILLAVAVLVIVIFLRKRRHSGQNKDEPQRDDANHYSQVDKTWNKNNFQSETQQKNSKDVDIEQLRLDNPNIDKEEGVYNHLGESVRGGEDKEDTYDHTGFVVGGGDCDYDTTLSIKRREQESTYGHAGIICSDARNADYDYGFNVLTEGSGKAGNGNSRLGEMSLNDGSKN